MTQKKILLSFLPWIIFSAGLTTFLNGALIAFVLNIVISRKDLFRGIVIEIGGILFFGAMILLGLFFPHSDMTLYTNL